MTSKDVEYKTEKRELEKRGISQKNRHTRNVSKLKITAYIVCLSGRLSVS